MNHDELDLLRQARDASRAHPETVRRLFTQLRDPEQARREAARPPDGPLQRAAAAVRALGRPAVLVPAVALLLVGLGAGVLALRWGPADVPLALTLEGADGGPLTVGADVALAWDGRGRVAGTAAAPRIAWTQGTLRVEVTPGAGVDLAVETEEARATVVGTVFSLTRDPRGTEVGVERGVVDVACADGGRHRVEAGARVTCWPVDLRGLLGRARALRGDGAGLSDVLAALDRALGREGPALLRGEVLAMRVSVLLEAGRVDDALRDVRRYLDEGHPARGDEFRALLEAQPSQ